MQSSNSCVTAGNTVKYSDLFCANSTTASAMCKFLIQSALSSGKGLGRAQNGISEAIKVKVKCGKGGVSINECTAVTILVPHLSLVQSRLRRL